MQPETAERTTEIYFCAACGQLIVAELPAGLKGVFLHASCRVDAATEYGVLDAEVIS